MPESNPKLALHGSNVTLTIFIGGKPQVRTDLAKKITVTEQVQQYRDKYLGRVRDRTDEQTTGYDLKIELDYAGSQLYAALLAQKAAREALQTFGDISIGLIFENRDGTTDGYLAQKCTTKNEINIGGKDDAVGHTIDVYAEDFKQVAL